MEINNVDNDQFVVSHELVQLMQWIIKHNPEGLKKVIEVAMTRENSSKLKAKTIYNDLHNEEDLQNGLLNFFSLMEIYLYEIENKNKEEKFIQKNIVPSINHVDMSLCDQATLHSCAAIATSKEHTQSNPKEVFLKELLKRWKPSKEKCTDN